jgi:hypothetical protein
MAARKSIRIPLRAQAGLGLRFSSAAAYSRLFEHSPPSTRLPLFPSFDRSARFVGIGLLRRPTHNWSAAFWPQELRRFKCKRPIFTKQFCW